jgi:hypothetical protein
MIHRGKPSAETRQEQRSCELHRMPYMIQSMSYVGLEHVGNSILFIINMSPDQLTTILAIARMSRSNASKDRSVDVTRSSNSRNRDDWSKRPDEISTSKSVLRVKFVLVRGVAEDWTTHLEPTDSTTPLSRPTVW